MSTERKKSASSNKNLAKTPTKGGDRSPGKAPAPKKTAKALKTSKPPAKGAAKNLEKSRSTPKKSVDGMTKAKSAQKAAPKDAKETKKIAAAKKPSPPPSKTKGGAVKGVKEKAGTVKSKPLSSKAAKNAKAERVIPKAKEMAAIPKPSKGGKPALASKESAKSTASVPVKPSSVSKKEGATPKSAVKAKEPTSAAKTMKPAAKKTELAPPPSNTNPDIVAKIRSAQANKESRKDLAQPAPKPSLVSNTQVPPLEKGKDRLILMVRDAFWLHAHWDITRQTVERARVSIAEHWHTAKPILRLLKLDDNGTTNNAETVFQDVEIHGGVRNWYLQIEVPGCSFKVQLGYVTSNGRFYELVRSNTVTMPMAGSKEVVDDHWADIAKDAERIYAMSGGYNEDTQSGDLAEVFEERLKRTMDTDVLSQFGSGAEGSLKRNKQFYFEVDAELIVFGSTHSDAHVNVGGEPVKVRSDGSFSVRLPLPDRRQVLPATAKSRDGVDEQTVVIAVERNTKVMEPLSMDVEDL
ncbi:hypothetical protein VN12_21565 [Pirellula sp. SH-Sr6A]|uniref:DUF4912 domain-containing protein n=1 Tax=Pirellula sp. SH-Sr6A TaxID=1632865 RepID=UPI00078D9954|nr:DUF4912 domain-containing protein [Pirellula sp. SH-Sr6A]AMV34729.1 hypothetical protein VN12_21565 [Pirellula sp. SH-Sr6A]